MLAEMCECDNSCGMRSQSQQPARLTGWRASHEIRPRVSAGPEEDTRGAAPSERSLAHRQRRTGLTTATFEAYGASHLTTLVALACVYGALRWRLRGGLREPDATRLSNLLALVVLVHEVGNVSLHVFVYGYPWSENLPLNFCRANMWLSVWMLARRSHLAYEIAYFWAVVGAGLALVTPDLSEPFPHPLFFTFFVGHGLGIFAVLFATWGLGFAPRLRSIGVSLAAACGLAVVAWLANRALGTNYLYLAHRPEGSSLLDVFEPFPGYLAGVLCVGVAAAFMAWLPFVGHRRD